MTKKIEVNIPNRIFYSIITLIFISLLAIGVYAYNTNNPSVMGHTMGEIQSSCTGLLRWTGSEWACISMPPTCNGENQVLHWSGSAWSCYTIETLQCDLMTKSCTKTANIVSTYPNYGNVCTDMTTTERNQKCTSLCSANTVINPACNGDISTSCTGGTSVNYNTGVAISCSSSYPFALGCACSSTQNYQEEIEQ